ncbi:MAG: nitroreductase family protein [Spirochaetota bacterium]
MKEDYLIIDRTKCKKDMLCIDECPFNLIETDKENGYPKLIPNAEKICNSCGHCVAVCPHDAISHTNVPIEESPLIDDKLAINKDQAIQFLRSRRSIRRFKDKAVEKEKIEQLIEIAKYAPTARNAQRLEWLVYTDKAEMKALSGFAVDWIRDDIKKHNGVPSAPYYPLIVEAWEAGKDMILRDAPALIIISAPKDVVYGMVDISLALSYLELSAPLFGLGTCWAGLLENALKNWPSAFKSLGLAEDRIHHYPMMLGYPVPRYYRLPQRRKPRITWK